MVSFLFEQCPPRDRSRDATASTAAMTMPEPERQADLVRIRLRRSGYIVFDRVVVRSWCRIGTSPVWRLVGIRPATGKDMLQ